MSEVKPIPEGFHTITPHIVCQSAKEAVEYYKKAFNAEEIYSQNLPGQEELLHATMKIGDSTLMVMDEFQEWGNLSPATLKGTPVTLHLYVENVDDIFKQAVDNGAKVIMNLQDTFWGDRYCMIEDPFGHKWSIATHIQDIEQEVMEKVADFTFRKKDEETDEQSE